MIPLRKARPISKSPISLRSVRWPRRIQVRAIVQVVRLLRRMRSRRVRVV